MDYDEKIAAIERTYAVDDLETPAGETIPSEAALAEEMEERIESLMRAREKERAEKSYIGRIGKFIEPVFAPIGIDWRGSVALLTGFVAKEIVVSTMGVLYAVDAEDDADALRSALRASGMTPMGALAMMVFVLLYIPCLAAVTAIIRESGSVKWALFNIGYTTSLAWLAAFIVFQGGTALGF